ARGRAARRSRPRRSGRGPAARAPRRRRAGRRAGAWRTAWTARRTPRRGGGPGRGCWWSCGAPGAPGVRWARRGLQPERGARRRGLRVVLGGAPGPAVLAAADVRGAVGPGGPGGGDALGVARRVRRDVRGAHGLHLLAEHGHDLAREEVDLLEHRLQRQAGVVDEEQ